MERVKERYQIRGRFVLYAGNIKPHKNLERLIAAFGLLKQRPGNEDLKLLIIGDEINKYGSLRRRVEAAGVRQDVRFFGFVPDSDAGRAVPHGLRVRLPVALRGLRAAAAGGDGLRHAGRDLAHLVAARGGGRRRACSSIPTASTTSRGGLDARARRRRRCARALVERGHARVAQLQLGALGARRSTPAT